MIDEKIPISVVVPTYSGMPLFKKSLESVLNQQDIQFEVLVGNDNPLDIETKDYLNSLTNENLRVFHHKSNMGLFGNLNYLIKNARGAIIHLWSQDDIMNEYCLAETVAFHEKHEDVAYVFSRVEVIDEHDRVVDKMSIDKTSIMSSLNHTLTSIVTGSVPGNIANVSIRKSIFEDYGYFDESLKYSGDFEYWCRITKNLPVGIIQKHLIKLRRHSGQLSRNPKMWIHRIQENELILNSFLKRVPKDRLPYVKRGIKWRVYNQYFGLYLSLIKSGHKKEAKSFLAAIKKYSGLFGYIFRYTFLKILMQIKKDKKFINWYYYQDVFKS